MFLYADGPTFEEIEKLKVDGYTFNPSLYKKLGAKNYIEFSKDILKKIPKKPISIEVIGDNYNECLREAKIINKLSENIWVKIPITFTNGSSTAKLISSLVEEGIKLNITAIFAIEQVKKILPILKNSNSILSIFSGRIYDIGLDASQKFLEMSDLIHDNSNCKSLWASCRMTYDYITAKNCSADIITMSPSLIDKMKLFKKDPLDYSKETVIGFYEDSMKAGFKI
jgi:transaldolase